MNRQELDDILHAVWRINAGINELIEEIDGPSNAASGQSIEPSLSSSGLQGRICDLCSAVSVAESSLSSLKNRLILEQGPVTLGQVAHSKGDVRANP